MKEIVQVVNAPGYEAQNFHLLNFKFTIIIVFIEDLIKIGKNQEI